jgi:hypothetical protein
LEKGEPRVVRDGRTLGRGGNQIQLGRCGRGGAQAGAAMEERVGVAGGGLRRVVCGQLFTEEEEDKGS